MIKVVRYLLIFKMNTKIIIFVIAALLIGGGAITFFSTQRGVVSTPVPQLQEEKPVPDLAFTDYNGNTVKLSDFRGKPVVANAWAAWCPFCREELPDFSALQKEFGDKIVVIAIDRAESLDVAKRYSDELGVTDEFLFVLDPSDSFYRSIGGFSMPETIFIDEQGFIKDHRRGPMDLEEMKRRVQQAFSLSIESL